MRKLLILTSVCLSLASVLHAQVPKSISISDKVFPTNNPAFSPDGACDAGTFVLGQFNGQSNDISLTDATPQVIYLCGGDNILVNHNGNASFMDPQVLTTPGVGWAFYKCPPTQTGPDLATVLTDGCIQDNPTATNGIWVATGSDPSGDITFNNTGGLQSQFNSGAPIKIWFAPITLDDFDAQAFEANSCVNVNTAVNFSVVYLNPITNTAPNTNAGNDCIGRFRLRGGLPQFDPAASYTVDISLKTNSNIKAVFNTPSNQFKHNSDIFFSVPQSGVYTVTVEDGKSCGHTFDIDMNVCDASDNITIDFPNLTAAPSATVCVPVTVTNITDINGASFNVQWDPNILQYSGIQNVNPALNCFSASNVEDDVAQGYLTLSYVNFVPACPNLTLPPASTFLEICFTVVGNLGDISSVNLANFPSLTDFGNGSFQSLALTVNAGSVTVGSNPLAIQATPANACGASSNIEVKVTGGTPPYDIVLKNDLGQVVASGSIGVAGGSFTFDGLGDGDYVVEVTDNNGGGATISENVTLVVKSIGAELVLTEPNCSGECSGQAFAKVSLGGFNVNNPGAEYTFTWAPVNLNLPNTQTVTGLCAGVQYSVTVTNTQEGCSAVAAGTMSQVAPIVEQTISVEDAACASVSDGEITFTAQGGSPKTGGDYDFAWSYSPNATDPGFPVDAATTNPVVLTDLFAGFYEFTVTDANGCTYVKKVEVGVKKELELEAVNIKNVSCFGGSDGELNIQLNTTPAQANSVVSWSYLPNTPSAVPVEGQTSYTLGGLPAGNYAITAVDASTCIVTSTFTVGTPTEISITTLTKIDPTCLVLNNGSVSITAQGGVPTYSYNWSNGGMQAGISGLVEGIYTVTVTDSKLCTETLDVELKLPTPPVITGVDVTEVKCGQDGCLKVNADNTATAYQWINITTGQTLPASPQICNLAGGEYAYTVRDADGCVASDTVTLAPKDGMVFGTPNYQQPSCFGKSDGVLGISVTGGTPNYGYQWLPTGSGQNLFNIPAGVYNVTVTDNNNCTLTGSFTLQQPPQIAVTFSGIEGVSCFGVCDGNATVAANYATVPPTAGTFNYRWEDNVTLNNAARTDLCTGNVMVTVTDANNCFTISEVYIDSTARIYANDAYFIPATCFGSTDGSAYVDAAGGNGAPFTYDWGTAGPMQQLISSLAAGSYTVTMTDGTGCTGEKTVVVLQPDDIAITTVDVTDPSCAGDDDGSIAVGVTGGNQGVFEFLWTNGVDTVGNSPLSISGIPSGAYTLIVKDSKGCTKDEDFVLNDPPAVQGKYLPWEQLECNGDQTTLYIDSIFGGSGGPYEFSLDYGVSLNQDYPLSMSGGAHTIQYIDRKGCITNDSIFVIEPDPILVVFNPNQVEIELGDTLFQLRPNISGAAVDMFTWTPAEDLDDPLILQPHAANYQTQTFTLTVFDAKGCSGSGSILVEVDPNRNVYLPNIFAPSNTSGLNDRFTPLIGNGVEGINYMRIYDRWGALLYERNDFVPNNNDFGEGWDGNYRGKKMKPDVYVYLVEARFLDGRVLLYRGDVTLVR